MQHLKPLHKHDCSFCVFITRTVHNLEMYDWYAHPPAHSGNGGTIVGRYGTMGDYISMPFFMLEDDRYTYTQGISHPVSAEYGMRIIAKEILRRYKEMRP
jgi:hypothetical protein